MSLKIQRCGRDTKPVQSASEISAGRDLNNPFFIGINGGHHQATAILYNQNSGDCLVCRGDSLNFHNLSAANTLAARWNTLFARLADAAGLDVDALEEKTNRTVIALPGALQFSDAISDPGYDFLRDSVESTHSTCHFVDDTWAGLYAETGGSHGICATASAGASVSLAINGFRTEKQYKIDGWGPVIGDYGSAFELAVFYLRRLGRALDAGHQCILFDRVKDFVNTFEFPTVESNVGFEAQVESDRFPYLLSAEEVQEWFDELRNAFSTEWRPALAQLARPILDAADEHGPCSSAARKLVEWSARRMVRSIGIACKRFRHEIDGLPVILQGGVFRNSKFYTQQVIDGLSEISLPIGPVSPSRFKPVVGALMLAVDGVREEGKIVTASSDKQVNGINGFTVRRQIENQVPQLAQR